MTQVGGIGDYIRIYHFSHLSFPSLQYGNYIF